MSGLYRVGNHNPRNIYRGSEHVGVMFAPADGPVVVAALNAAAIPRRCSDCPRSARQLKPWIEDGQIIAWLGPTCHRRRLAQAERAVAMPLGGER